MIEDSPASSAPEPPPAPVGGDHRGGEAARNGRPKGNIAVAVLLAIAAVVAAAIGTRASMVSSEASGAWQSALRTEVKRSVGAINDVSLLYLTEYPQAMRVLPAKMIADALRAAEAGQIETVAQALESEAARQLELVDALSATSPLTDGAAYVLPSGGFDLGKRLADIRAGGAEGPELLALDPDGLIATGDRLADKATLFTYALIPTSLCALLGILARPVRRYRRVLLAAGAAALYCGAVMALAVEVIA